MSNRFSARVRPLAAATAFFCVTSLPAAGQARRAPGACPDRRDDAALFHPCALAKAKTFTPPRTADGQPDLQGFWGGPGGATAAIEEHEKTFDRDGGKSLIVDPPDGKIPYQAWAAARREANVDKYVDPNMACFLSGVPRSLYVPGGFQILQPPGYVVLLFDRSHGYRVIPLDGRPHLGETISLWNGDSRGRWEGNTLVVDVTNQNGRTWLDQMGTFHTAPARMVERFTLIDPNTIHYEVTIEDPTVFTRPWTMAVPLKRNTDEAYELMEMACYEGERNTKIVLGLGYRFYPGITANEER
jgi:hypothetical protein